MADAISQDLRHAAGRLLRTPLLTAVVALTLGLGVAANVTTFSLLSSMFFRPLPVKAPDRLARIYTGTVESPQERCSYPDFVDYRAGVPSFDGLIATGRRGALLTLGDLAETLMVEVVSDEYFDVLGVAPLRGRVGSTGGADPSERRQVVISHDLWQRRFGGRDDVVGEAVRLSGRSLVVGGVMPPSFRGVDRIVSVDLWIRFDTWATEMNNASDFERRDLRWLDVWGRLSDDASFEQADAQSRVVATRLADAHPETNRGRTSAVVAEAAARRRQGSSLAALLLSLAGLVLLVCCANLANLLLAESEGRLREMATRAALGASRARVAGQVVAESLLLAILGGALGLLLASWLVALVPKTLPATSIRLNLDFAMDSGVWLFTAVVLLLTTVLLGTLPALHAARVELTSALRGGKAAGRERRSRRTVRDALVVGQIAACVALLVVAGLLVRSLSATVRVDAGFERKPMLLVELNPGLGGLDREEARRFLQDLTPRLTSLPGVEQAGYAMRAPLSPSGGGASTKVVVPAGDADAREGVDVKYNAVGPTYFRAMGIRVLRGRVFDSHDRPESQRVAVVSRTMAEQLWPSPEPVGNVIEAGGDAWTIVGVVEDAKINRLHESPEPYVYFPFTQRTRSEITYMIETSGAPEALADSVRAAVRESAPNVPVLSMKTQDELMRFATYSERLYARLASSLGLLGLFLAATGLFGVISYLVRQRTHEIGIRVALGAQRSTVALSFVKTGLVFAVVGSALGLSACAAAADLLAGFLHGVSPRDPVSFAAAAGVVVLTAAAASYLPARSAARVDPIQALRHD